MRNQGGEKKGGHEEKCQEAKKDLRFNLKHLDEFPFNNSITSKKKIYKTLNFR